MENIRDKKLVSVEIWDKANNKWQEYDCPDNGDTVGDYADWCVNEDSEYWATINSTEDKIRLNHEFVIDGAKYFDEEGELK